MKHLNSNINNTNAQRQESLYNYTQKIKTDQCNEMTLDIRVIDNKLSITCFYEKNYFKKVFSNSFSFEELKKQSPYFNMFSSLEQVLEEIKTNKCKGKEIIKGDEENSKSIEVIIPVPLTTLKNIRFSLDEENKKALDAENEKDFVIKRYELESSLINLKSKILIGKDIEKRAIKIWISPNKILRAKLLYSFDNGENKDLLNNPEEDKKVKDFHEACDNKRNILMICRSKNEIFGGYTPLSFNSQSKNEADNESFLFSVNGFKKYPKKNFSNSSSIKCHEDFGPCFSNDLFFQKYSMNIINLIPSEYLTHDDWVNKANCFVFEKGIIIDSLEIFQIKEENVNYDEIKIAINNNNTFNHFKSLINSPIMNNNTKITNFNINMSRNQISNININNTNNINIRRDEINKNNEENEFPLNIGKKKKDNKNCYKEFIEKVKKEKSEEKKKRKKRKDKKDKKENVEKKDKKENDRKSNESKMSQIGSLTFLEEEFNKDNTEDKTLIKDFNEFYDFP